MNEYTVTINDKTYEISVEPKTTSTVSPVNTNASDELSYEASKAEYEHCMQRSEKLDNKIYILLTVCAFLFVLLCDLIKKISNFSFPDDGIQLTLIIIFALCLSANIFLYTFTLIRLTNLLKGISVERFNPIIILEHDMIASDSKAVARYICSRYNQCIKTNNDNLEKRYKKFNNCVNCTIPIIFISFFLIFISNFIH